MAEFTVDAKGIRPDASVDAMILFDTEGCEGERGVVLPNVVSKLSSLLRKAKKQLLQSERWMWKWIQPYLTVVAARTKFWCCNRGVGDAFIDPMQSSAMDARSVHATGIVTLD